MLKYSRLNLGENMPDQKGNYTTTEVGTLVEALRGEFRAVVEVVAPLPDRLTAVENRLTNVETEVRGLKDVVRIAIPAIHNRLERIETKVGI